ncbi:hypothetical protein BofuT4_P034850.1 [Botrytis cinerea T4]|uniref:Uncharacterized protein n=1 Tax=Botryotinia fuckeliana (strain T4) TaxID=999810 RepID=G2Y6E0_BOTF4|nr:hypothetical protein BofuT4_P034850.1 [Botrytis cinerea T4]
MEEITLFTIFLVLHLSSLSRIQLSCILQTSKCTHQKTKSTSNPSLSISSEHSVIFGPTTFQHSVYLKKQDTTGLQTLVIGIGEDKVYSPIFQAQERAIVRFEALEKFSRQLKTVRRLEIYQ